LEFEIWNLELARTLRGQFAEQRRLDATFQIISKSPSFYELHSNRRRTGIGKFLECVHPHWKRMPNSEFPMPNYLATSLSACFNVRSKSPSGTVLIAAATAFSASGR